MLIEGFKKYRGLFISTTLFVVFFIVCLVINALQQRNAIRDIEYFNFSQKIYTHLNEKGVYSSFIDDLKAIKNGGTVKFSDLYEISLPAIANYLPKADSIIGKAISLVESSTEPDQGELAKQQMHEFSSIVLDKKNRSIKLLKMLQIVVVIITVLLYFVVIVQLVLEISKTDDIEVQSKKETEGIMSTLSEGIFLLDKDYQIGSEQSASLKNMFKSEKDLEGNFLDFIATYVTQKTVDLAHEYLELLYGDRVKERLVEELNPLKKVEVNIVRRDGTFESNYLDFKFKRVMIDKKVSHLLGSVTDVTKQVLLERELDATKEAQEAQLDMLKSILYIDRNKLTLFFSNANEILQDVNRTLESEGKVVSDENIRVMLNQIGSKIHRIKGDAAALGIHRFEFSAHDLEDTIDTIKKDRNKLTGKNLIPLTTGMRKMFSDLEDLKELIGKFSGIEIKGFSPSKTTANENSDPAHQESIDIIGPLINICETVSTRNNKDVELNLRGLVPNLVPNHLAGVILSIATQCIRNSIIHGIESKDERIAAGKPPRAMIKVIFAGIDEGYMLTIRDDGQGIDEDKVLRKAVSMNLIPADFSERISKDKIRELLLNSGFSTKDEADMDAGRGFGLDVIKELVDENGGRMNISYEKDKFFRISVLFPFSINHAPAERKELCAS